MEKKKLKIEEMQKIARQRGGKCLSTEYINMKTKLEWQCKKGHTWEASLINIKNNGTWCPVCGGTAKLTIEEMQKLAKQRGGKCLSTNYLNIRSKLKWQCKEGHIWKATPHNVKGGAWCPKCAGREKLTIEEMQELAKHRGGECLSTEYINAHMKLKWKCKEGHIWYAPSKNVKNCGAWCPKCAGREKLTIEEMQELAKHRGGECLSTEYINNRTKLLWQCNAKHSWEATPDKIKRGEWCPICAIRKREYKQKRLSIEEMQEIAKQRGGQCLSPIYINNRVKLKWKCKDGHIWEATPRDIKSGTWCPECGGTAKLTIEEMQKLAKQRGGKCLSTDYINARSKLKWQCKEGHMWKATPDNIKRNRWCPKCASKEKLAIEEMQKLARQRGGMCLSTEYINVQTNLKWQCKEGHIWFALPSNIKKGRWCPKCSGREKLTIKEMQKLAREHGGECLSTEYINNSTNLLWQCKEGHIWEAIPSNIKNGHWCPECAGIISPTIEDMQEIAKQRGGKCLSPEYMNAKTSLKWQCKKGHIWKAIPDSIKRNTWCPICSHGISERICRKIIEIMFQSKFPKSRPRWLINNAGNHMELDGYSKKLALAFEYQGIQHYEFVSYFYNTIEDFEKRKEDDKAKRILCEKHKVFLFVIPYTIEYNQIQDYIIELCKDNNIKIPQSNEIIEYMKLNVFSPEKLSRMKEIAKERGGKCLSTEYVNARTKLKWECKEGHIWEAFPYSIKKGYWCPTCARKRRKNTSKIRSLDLFFGSDVSFKTKIILD